MPSLLLLSAPQPGGNHDQSMEIQPVRNHNVPVCLILEQITPLPWTLGTSECPNGPTFSELIFFLIYIEKKCIFACLKWSCSRVARHSSAKAATPVRIWSGPQ